LLQTEKIMTELTYSLFKSHAPVVQYVFEDGSIAVFRAGRFYTQDKRQIAELTAICTKGHPTIFIDPEEAKTSPENEDPREKLKAQLRAEIMAEMAVRDVSAEGSTANSLGATSTASVASLSIGNTLASEALEALTDAMAAKAGK
jgi:hypothetical protein